MRTTGGLVVAMPKKLIGGQVGAGGADSVTSKSWSCGTLRRPTFFSAGFHIWVKRGESKAYRQRRNRWLLVLTFEGFTIHYRELLSVGQNTPFTKLARYK
jgi:hypothetical protein